MDQRPSVSICVVTHNCEADIAPFFEAISKLDPPPIEVIVIDSASGDGTVAALRSAGGGALPLVIEALPDNAGYAGGMNRAVSLSRSDWILALNADCLPAPDFVSRMIEAADIDSAGRVAAVTGRLTRFADGPESVLDACGMFLTWTWRHHDRGSGRADRGQYSHRELVFGGTGAALLLRREALDDAAIDGEPFAAEFHSFREDAELAFRLRERGWEVVYEPAATARHRRTGLPSRRRQLPARINYHSLKNRYLLRAYHQSGANFLLTLIPATLRDLAALAWVVAFERSSLEAYRWLWRNRADIVRKRRLLRARRTGGIGRWFWGRSRPA